jgi:hypothetical protein
MKKRRLHAIVDSVSYVTSEVYQHQLHEELTRLYEVSYHELSSLGKIYIDPGDVVFSALKLRSVKSHLNRISAAVGNNLIIVQDYDPWVSFEDGSPYKGAYTTIQNHLNAKFFVPSKNWCDLISRRNITCRYHPIGMAPRYCTANPWENRDVRLEFRGSSYPSREAGMHRLVAGGLPDPWVRKPIKPYSSFLEHLTRVRVWAHNENETIIVDGEHICRNWLWPKAIEVLSRGCFLIRDWQPESENYVSMMPTARLYRHEAQANDLLLEIESLEPRVRNEMILETVEQVRRADYYRNLSLKIAEWYDE